MFPDKYDGSNDDYDFNTNSYKSITLDELAALEAKGAVFLPGAGYRSGTNVKNTILYGYYWSSSPHEMNEFAKNLCFTADTGASFNIFTPYFGDGSRSSACSVRLVRDKI